MDEPHRPPVRLSRWQLFRLSSMLFGLQLIFTTVPLLVLPEMTKHFMGESHKNSWLTLVTMCGAIVTLATQFTVGFLSDHTHSWFGRRRPYIVAGVLGTLPALAAFMLAPSYWWMLAGYLLVEITINTASVPFQSLLPDLVPDSQINEAGAQMGLCYLGGQLAGLIALVLAGSGGFVGVLLPTYLILLPLTAALVVFGVDERRWAQGRHAELSGKIRELCMPLGVRMRYVETAPTLFGAIYRHYRSLDLRGNPTFVWLAVSRFAIFFGYATFVYAVDYYVKYNLDWRGFLTQIHLAPKPGEDSASVMAAGIMLMFFVISGLAGNLLSARLAHRFGKKAVIGGAVGWVSILFIPLIFTHSVWVAVAVGSLLGMGWGAFIAMDWAFACQLMPKEHTGSFMGIWDITTLLPQVIAPFIGPALDAFTHAHTARLGMQAASALSYQYAYGLVIVYFCIGLFLLRKVNEPRPAVLAKSAASL